MIKCVRITVTAEINSSNVLSRIQKHARMHSIEGSAQENEGKVKIIACGQKDNVEDFVDLVHKELALHTTDEIEVEPFLKDRDYRGVFRVIE